MKNKILLIPMFLLLLSGIVSASCRDEIASGEASLGDAVEYTNIISGIQSLPYYFKVTLGDLVSFTNWDCNKALHPSSLMGKLRGNAGGRE